MLDAVGKPSVRRGARALFRSIWTYGGKVIEFQSFSMNKKIKNKNFYFHFAYGNDAQAH